MSELTLGDLLHETSRSNPALIQIRDDQSRAHISYSQLRSQILDLSSQLTHIRAVHVGRVTALVLGNTVECVTAFLAVTRSAGIVAPLNMAYTHDEFVFYFKDANVRSLLLPAAGVYVNAESAATELSIPVFFVSVNVDSSMVVVTPKDGAEPASETINVEEPTPDHEAMYLHTSGTTSRPKLVPLTHKNLMTTVKNIIATYELTKQDRTILVMPLFHVHGLMCALLSSLASGGAVILQPAGKFSASSFWKHADGITWYTAVPTIHQILLMRAGTDYNAETAPKLRFIRSCSASLAVPVLEQLETTFHAPVLEAYAMTEAAHQMTSNPLPKHGPRKPGSVGKGTNVQVAILNDSNELVETGVVGEVCIRGDNVTSGYKNNEEANRTAFGGGWFHTGDQGFLDAEGYVTLTGRLKELINRGGEKISPPEVDSALLSHPNVGEAVCFGAPDAKYGEVVNAAVILKPGSPAITDSDLIAFCNTKLASFKVPSRIFITGDFPRTATGKIQRRHVRDFFLNGSDNNKGNNNNKDAATSTAAGKTASPSDNRETLNGFQVVAKALKAAGVRYMFGVVGIPVTALATCVQAEGIRFISFRNEQAAGYAAAAAGYLTGVPGALLTVSGPGAVHGLAGLLHGTANRWPIVMLSGSTDTRSVGRGGFQELDQIALVKPFVKYAGQASDISTIAHSISQAVQATTTGTPGSAYVDLPSDVLRQSIEVAAVQQALETVHASAINEILTPPPYIAAENASFHEALQLLNNAKKPLLVIGKGAALARAEQTLFQFVTKTGIPFLSTPMGKGVITDMHEHSVAAARSLALAECDVCLVVGARLNWILHFGDAPKWNANTKFVMVDVDSVEAGRGHVSLVGHARSVVDALNESLASGGLTLQVTEQWKNSLHEKVTRNVAAMEKKLSHIASPLDHLTASRVIRDAIQVVNPAPIFVSEGANTMDIARSVIPQTEPRSRLDAGTWGTMGVGLGFAVASAVCHPDRLTVAVEGDSAFGFSGMEVEVLVRYQLPVVVFVFNNGGIYGGSNDPSPYPGDPLPTSFVPNAHYDLLITAFGGDGYHVTTAEELEQVCKKVFEQRKPALVNIVIDPKSGTESGSMQSHN